MWPTYNRTTINLYLAFVRHTFSPNGVWAPTEPQHHSGSPRSGFAAQALVVYEKLGVAILRRAWFNLDLIWLIALMASAVLIILA